MKSAEARQSSRRHSAESRRSASMLSTCRIRPATLATVLAVATWLPAASAAEFAAHHLFVCSEGSHRVLEFNAQGELVRSLGAGTGLVAPAGLAFGPDGRLYVASSGSNQVLVFAPNGGLVDVLGEGNALPAPRGLAFGPDGSLHVAAGDGLIHRFAPDGSLLEPIGADAGLVLPADLRFGADGQLFVADAATGEVVELSPEGLRVAGFGGAPDVIMAVGVTLSADGRLAISTGASNQVRFASADGELDTLDLTGSLAGTSGLADGPDGLLYIVARSEARIVAVNADGDVVRDFGADSGLLLGGAAAFAPRRFPLRIRGAVTLAGVEQTKFKADGRISVLPGSRTLLLSFELPANGDEEAAAALGGGWLVLRGSDAANSKDTQRLLLGHARSFGPDGARFASLLTELPGPPPDGGNVNPKAARGELVCGSATGVFRGTVRTGKPLN